MKIIVPDYYDRFRCIAGQCQHSCCIGWEIDIDEDSCARYRSVGGDFGRRLEENIQWGEDSCFRLGEDERCPFLNGENLCDIIINMGEEGLCQICADHPRFRNFFDSRTEMGLGLCCEAAAELIVNNPNTVKLIALEDDSDDRVSDSEKGFFEMRGEIFAIVQKRRFNFDHRIAALLSRFEISLPRRSISTWPRIYASLEQLDPQWGLMLDKLSLAEKPATVLSDIEQEQLLVYFIYRHLSDGMRDGFLRERIVFCLLSVDMIDALCAVSSLPAAEIARMYSAEIEYSDENIERLLGVLGEWMVDDREY